MPDTPETLNYLYLGLGTTAVLMIGYIVSVFVRYRNLQKDIELLQQMADEE